MRATATPQLRNRLDELAADIGRLHKRAKPDTVDHWLTQRLATHIQTIYALLEPTAADLAVQTFPGDPETIQLAIREVDQRAQRLQQRLGQ